LKQIFLDLLTQLQSVNTAWVSSTSYSAGQYVWYNGVTYRSNSDNNTGHTPGTDVAYTNIPYWQPTPFFVGAGGVQLVPFIGAWNNQLKQWQQGKLYDVQKPAIFIEFVTNEIIVLGQGIESFDPLDIKVHIIDDMLDAGDGTQEQNLRIFDFKQQVYQLLKKFEPTGCTTLFRLSETQDYDHDNLYHYIQTYRTSYIDSAMQLPVGLITYYPPVHDTIAFTIDPTYPAS